MVECSMDNFVVIEIRSYFFSLLVINLFCKDSNSSEYIAVTSYLKA